MTTMPHKDYEFDDFDDRSIPGCGRWPANPSPAMTSHGNKFAFPTSSNPSRAGSVSQASSWDSMGELQPCWSIWSSTLPATSGPPPIPATAPAAPTAVPAQSSGFSYSGNLFPSTPPQPQWTQSPSLGVAKPQSTSLWFGTPAGSPATASSLPSFGCLGPSFAPSNGPSQPQTGTAAIGIPGSGNQLVSPPLSPQTSADQILGSPPQVFAMDCIAPPSSVSAGAPAPVSSAPSATAQVSTGSAAKGGHSGPSVPALGSYFEDSRPMLFDGMPDATELQGVIAATAEPLYFVKFKGGRMDVFSVSDKTVHPIGLGDLVVVDADRGRDVGKVVAANVPEEQAALVKWQQHHERQQVLGQCSASKEPAAPLTTCTPKHILRAAQASEVRQLVAKQADEAKAIALCNQKARERQLDMSVVDAEFQWDRRKLTFFYRAHQRVDFRDLVRELFRIYKTRIWMCAVA